MAVPVFPAVPNPSYGSERRRAPLLVAPFVLGLSDHDLLLGAHPVGEPAFAHGRLREADAGVAVKDLCRKHGFSEGSYYLWRSKFGGMSVSDAKRLKELETENTRLKKLLAESLLENEVTREVLRKKW